jgi:aspartate racemase
VHDIALASGCFEIVAADLVTQHALGTLVLACTEIPLALKTVPAHAHVSLLDPAEVLARALAERAYATA